MLYIALPVRLSCTASDYPFGIFKLFPSKKGTKYCISPESTFHRKSCYSPPPTLFNMLVIKTCNCPLEPATSFNLHLSNMTK